MSLDLPVPGDKDGGTTPAELLPDEAPPIDQAVAIRVDLHRFVGSLPQPLLESCAILLADSVAEGARAAGIHRSTAYQRATRLRAEAIAFGLSVYFAGHSDSQPSASVNGDQGADLQANAGADLEWAPMPQQTRPPRPRLLITEIEFRAWLARADEGEFLEYHRGFLAIDRLLLGSRLPSDDCGELDRVAKSVLALADGGHAHLVQRRLGPGEYSYLFFSRRKPASFARANATLAEDAP